MPNSLEKPPGAVADLGNAAAMTTADTAVMPAESITRSVQLAIKRLFDFSLALGGLVLLSPVMAFVAVLVRVNLGSPVIFKQVRPGYRMQPIQVLKFRTMTSATDATGRPLPDAQRLTSFGKFLRRSSLDELPQLWNVVRGDVSLVGPRPLLMEYLPHYTTREKLRFEVRPGITGWAQIRGRNLARWDDRLSDDAWYVENWSLWLDLKILFRTFIKVLYREGTVADQYAVQNSLDVERSAKTAATP